MFIVIEGIDGSGKSTTIRELEKYLKKIGKSVHTTMEPTEAPSGKLIRTFLKQDEKDSPFLTKKLALAFAMDRLNHLETEILPKSEAGEVVISDRYIFSSIAYQSLHLPESWVREINRYAVMPDLLIFIDISTDTALSRINTRNEERELFEKREILEKVSENYSKTIDLYKNSVRTIILDGEVGIDGIYPQIEEKLKSIFEEA